MANVYKIGVEIALAGNIKQGLEAIASRLTGINTKVREVEGGFSRWAVGIGGVASIFASGAIISGLSKMADAGSELLDQQNQLLRLGIAQKDVAALTANYWQNIAKAVPTSTVSEYLQTVKELRAVTGDLISAEKLAPDALKFDALISNVTGQSVHGQLYQILRAAELKGIATDPEKTKDLAQQSYNYIAAFGGKLTADMIKNMAVRGGTAWMNADLKTAFGPMAVLAAEMGSSGSSASAGVVLNQLQQLMLGAHTLTRQQAATLAHLGLLDTSKTMKTGFGGGSLQLQPGAMIGSEKYAGNVPGWAKDIVWPAIVKAAKGDPALIDSLLAKIAPNVNTQKAIELFGNPEFLKQQLKDLGLSAQQIGEVLSYKSFVGDNPKGVREAYDAQYGAMREAMGAAVAPLKMDVLKELTSLFTSIGQVAAAHPEAIKVVAEGLAAVAVALGAIGIVSLGMLIGVPAAIASVVTALGTLVVVNWQSIESVFTGIANAIKAFIAGLTNLHIPDFMGGNTFGPGGGPSHGPGFGGGQKMNWIAPPGNSRPMVIHTALNIDGRRFAQLISHHIVRLHEFSTQAPAPDGRSLFTVPDHNLVST